MNSVPLFGKVYDAYGEIFRVPFGASKASNALVLLAARNAAAVDEVLIAKWEVLLRGKLAAPLSSLSSSSSSYVQKLEALDAVIGVLGVLDIS